MVILAAERIDWPTIAFWLALLAILIVGAAGAVWVLRGKTLRAEDSSAMGFTLQDLREMRDRGDLTEVEYQAARIAALGEATRSANGADGLSDNPRKGEGRT